MQILAQRSDLASARLKIGSTIDALFCRPYELAQRSLALMMGLLQFIFGDNPERGGLVPEIVKS